MANHPTHPTGRWPTGIDPARIPRHIALIMDGNGRWATQRGLERSEGHLAAEAGLMAAIYAAEFLGVQYLTVFAFSTENWDRPDEEVSFLMDFDRALLLRRQAELHEKGMRVHFIGRRSGKTPPSILRIIEDTEELTGANKGIDVIFAFNYGGRAEIVDAARSIAVEARDRGIDPTELTEDTFHRYLYDPSMPDVDLLIRTSGEHRISNFLLWQAAYAEIVFMSVLFPDFRRRHLYDAVRKYQARERRFGGLQDE